MDDTPNHDSRDHAELGASSSDRWFHCPGSLNLAREIGAISKSSVYAEEGTAAHELAHLCLLRGQDAIEYIDRRLPSWTPDTPEISDEMASAIQIYLDKCRSYTAPGVELLTEQKFNLKKLDPPAPMFGTADFVAINVPERKITIVDLKYGKGINVEAQDNPQLQYYALGALCTLPPGAKINTVETVIVQPRTSGAPIKTATYLASKIFAFSIELMAHARAAMAPDAPRASGSWCRFCPCAGQCDTQRDAAYSLAQMQFAPDAALVGEVLPPPKQAAVAVRKLTPEQVSRVLHDLAWMEAFADAVRGLAKEMIQNGVDVPDWKLVPGLGNRAWVDEDTVTSRLTRQLGLDEKEAVVSKVISPAQAEKLAIGKLRAMGMKLKDAEPMVKNTLAKLIHRPETAPILVRSSDARPAITARGSEFEVEQPPR